MSVFLKICDSPLKAPHVETIFEADTRIGFLIMGCPAAAKKDGRTHIGFRRGTRGEFIRPLRSRCGSIREDEPVLARLRCFAPKRLSTEAGKQLF
jgi:hypothetical protein